MTTQEKWVRIGKFKNNDFAGKYEVSSWGIVRNAETKLLLKTFLKAKNSRYEKVALYDQEGKRINVYVHQLVAAYFLPAQPEGTELDHIDGNAHNNSFSNLEWVTHRENCRRAIDGIRRAEGL